MEEEACQKKEREGNNGFLKVKVGPTGVFLTKVFFKDKGGGENKGAKKHTKGDSFQTKDKVLASIGAKKLERKISEKVA